MYCDRCGWIFTKKGFFWGWYCCYEVGVMATWQPHFISCFDIDCKVSHYGVLHFVLHSGGAFSFLFQFERRKKCEKNFKVSSPKNLLFQVCSNRSCNYILSFFVPIHTQNDATIVISTSKLIFCILTTINYCMDLLYWW